VAWGLTTSLPDPELAVEVDSPAPEGAVVTDG